MAILLTGALLTLLAGPGEHSSATAAQTAAAKASAFAEVALVRRDFPAAYRMLSPAEQGKTALAEFSAGIASQHTQGYPLRIVATAYELVPAHSAVHVFLIGEGRSGSSYYRISLVGSVEKGYSPVGLMRSAEPFPAFDRERRPLLQGKGAGEQ